MNGLSRSILVLSSLAPFALVQLASASPEKAHLPYSKVSSLIHAKCESCHNAKAHPEAIDLSSFEALMKSGEHGPIVIPGHPEKSKLIQYVDGEKQPRMPYHKAPLRPSEIALLKRWISAGASK